MTKHPTASAGADYDTLRAQRQAAMTDAERQIYDTAYAEAGWAMELAELVYTTRTQAGLTQVELAAAMGTSQSAIAAWENGSRTPGIEALERLARACGRNLHITIGAARSLQRIWLEPHTKGHHNQPNSPPPRARSGAGNT